jgi:hypothetical protein
MRNAMQPPVARPQGCSCRKPNRSEQMDIDVADAAAVQGMVIYEFEDFHVSGNADLWQVRQVIQNLSVLTEMTQCELPNNEGMRQHHFGIQEGGKRLIAGAQMVYPNRRIDQNHAGLGRRRGGRRNLSSLPPSFASRRALSRSISALSASRTRRDFSVNPVSA